MATGEVREAKIVTGVDDHSRFCVMAAVVERATARAVCSAFAQALAHYGPPEEVITDNGKQFTDRFGRYGASRGEVLFDKICRHNGITHRLTQPASPNQNGKVERFHGTFRPDFLADADPFESVAAAQAAVDGWVADYNAERPHQGLDPAGPVVPADRFRAAAPVEGVELWLPPTLDVLDGPPAAEPDPLVRVPGSGGPIELDRPVPPSGNMALCGNQFWLGPAPGRAGRAVLDRLRLGAPVDRWAADQVPPVAVQRQRPRHPHRPGRGASRAAAAGVAVPVPDRAGRTIVEVERTVGRNGTCPWAQRTVLAAEILAGRRVGIYIEEGVPVAVLRPRDP